MDLVQIETVRISFAGLIAWDDSGLMGSRVSLHLELKERSPVKLLTAQVSSQHLMSCHHHTSAL